MTEQRNVTFDDIRALAMSMPEVTEDQHGRYGVPRWKVRGKTLVGIAADRASVVFCVTESAGSDLASKHPHAMTLEYRPDAHRSFLGVQLSLVGASPGLLAELTKQAWIAKAPKTLAKENGIS